MHYVDKKVLGTPYEKLTIGVPREVYPEEMRVALSPQACKVLTDKGFKVNIEEGAGAGAQFLDSDYINAGAKVVPAKDAFNADIVLKVGQVLI